MDFSEFEDCPRHIIEKNGKISAVFNMDCVKGLEKLNPVDWAIIDPPYGHLLQKKGGYFSRYFGNLDWNVAPDDFFFEILLQKAKNVIVWGGNFFPVLWREPCKCYLIWDKNRSNNLALSYAHCELAWTNLDSLAKIFRFGINEASIKKNPFKFHATMKPLQLYEWIYRIFVPGNSDIWVLDTHLGSGTNRIAAFKHGVNFIGFEINEFFFKKSCDLFNIFLNNGIQLDAF